MKQIALGHVSNPKPERDEILDDSRLFDRSRKATLEQEEEAEEMNLCLEEDDYTKPN